MPQVKSRKDSAISEDTRDVGEVLFMGRSGNPWLILHQCLCNLLKIIEMVYQLTMLCGVYKLITIHFQP